MFVVILKSTHLKNEKIDFLSNINIYKELEMHVYYLKESPYIHPTNYNTCLNLVLRTPIELCEL